MSQSAFRCDVEDWKRPVGQSTHCASVLRSLSSSYRLPAPHVLVAVQLVSRCPTLLRYVCCPQSVHVRAAVLESALMYRPAAHVVCVVHVSIRCPVASWYVSSPQALQVCCTVVDASDIFCPAAHVGCDVQDA